MTKIACIGDIALDHYVNLNEKYVGGISFNVTWNLRQLGVDARIVSALGSDDTGRLVLETLEHTSMPRDMLLQLPGLTACQRIVLKENGERVFDGYKAGVLAELFDNPSLISGIVSSVDLIHTPLSDGMERLFSLVALANTNALKIADFSIDASIEGGVANALQEYAPRFDMVFLGGNPDHGGFIEELSIRHPDVTFVLTLGRLGSYGWSHGRHFHQPCIPVESVIDTTGCGDGFQAAFIASWLTNEGNLPGSLKSGAQHAAGIASRVGATGCRIG
jgi:fructoselysine 6-kinase